MIHQPIYKPKARAGEYGDLAINIYRGCSHGCDYCFAPGVLRMTREAFADIRLRNNIVKSAERQLKREGITGKLIHLCFTCDPYPANFDTTPTREIIELLKQSGNFVQILTKGGLRAERDFDLLGDGDWIGATITGGGVTPHSYEPNAAPHLERLAMLKSAHERGINTWVSCEPVFDPQTVFTLIESCNYIDLYRIGKLNHRKSYVPLSWAVFGAKCVDLCKKHNRNFYIKDDLRNEMAKGGKIDFSDCPYWSDEKCLGFNCCTERYCPHARESQPMLFEYCDKERKELPDEIKNHIGNF